MKRSILIGGLLLPSCRLLKKENQSQKILIQKEALEVIAERETQSQQSEVVLVDSSQANYTLTLWPKGKFTYNLAKGFEGEAERLVFTGKNTQIKVLETRQQTYQNQTLLKANYTQEKETSKVIQKHKESIGFNLGWFLFVVVVLATVFIYRKFRP